MNKWHKEEEAYRLRKLKEVRLECARVLKAVRRAEKELASSEYINYCSRTFAGVKRAMLDFNTLGVEIRKGR